MYEQVTSYLGKLKPAHWKSPENQGGWFPRKSIHCRLARV